MLVGALRSFVNRFKGIHGLYSKRQPTYNVHDAHFRLDCLLAMLVRMKPIIQRQQLDFNGLDLQAFENNLKYVLRYAMSEMCCYFKHLCKLIIKTCAVLHIYKFRWCFG